MNEFPITSTLGKEMFSYLPQYYETSRVMKANIDTQGAEMDLLRQAFDETLSQYFVRTATWGLNLWERELGLTTDSTKPIEQRRSVVESKLRGVGTVTVALIKSVAEAYDGGTVEVTEQPALYQFTVTFVDTRGIPPNLDDLKAGIDEIKPAHLAVEYEFTYTTWAELRRTTWGNAKRYTWQEIKTRRW
ncbi:YmfQ family protein [Paenibacillus sp. MSJ-34]|uniref:YmfQ family protein n=1 Tax=Paenibacillus sp. MSJ-34 TaxID=2841529 RepID=UPI001C1055D9|nr:YmfQ family protein [Paenibacillus sp. MSJ-34]MBU5441200.1 YmfQ family protein [Paenibacillus sp. MSJ-34]